MTSKLSYKLCMFMIISASVGNLVGCSTPVSTITSTSAVTNTIAPTKTLVPTSTATSTATVMPPVTLPTAVISGQNISEIKRLESRELVNKPKDFLPRSMDFTPDGRRLVADNDETVYIWDGLTGELVNTFNHSHYLWNVAISPNGKIVAAGGESDVIQLWNLTTSEESLTLTHPDTIWSLVFSPDSTILASGTLDQTVKFWNVGGGLPIDEITDVLVNSLAFSPDGRQVAIGTDSKILLWDISAKKMIATFQFDLRGGEGLSGIQGVLFSPDGKLIAAADADNIAMVWNIASGKRVSTIVGKGTIIRMSEGTLAFSPDSKIIAAGNDKGDVIFWDVVADTELYRTGSETCIPLDLIFSSEQNVNVFEIACQNGAIQFWGIP